jgi:hypothetical protein
MQVGKNRIQFLFCFSLKEKTKKIFAFENVEGFSGGCVFTVPLGWTQMLKVQRN